MPLGGPKARKTFTPWILALPLPAILFSRTGLLHNMVMELHHCRDLHKSPHQVDPPQELQVPMGRLNWAESETFLWANTGNQMRNTTT